MRFFRGLSVKASELDSVVSTISATGLKEGDGGWLMRQLRPGPIEELFCKTGLSTAHTRGPTALERPAVCACGELDGATYYAWRHNRTGENDTPVIVQFDAEPEMVSVDGRDFLYTVFQMGDPPRARGALERCFGSSVLRYAERAWQTDDQQCRIALCDLATRDPKVVEEHYASRTVIGGRHRTTFRNAFTVELPIESSRVVGVWSPSRFPGLPISEVRLDDVLMGRP